MKIVNETDRTLKIIVKNKDDPEPEHTTILFNIKARNGRYTEYEDIDIGNYDMMIIKYRKDKKRDQG